MALLIAMTAFSHGALNVKYADEFEANDRDAMALVERGLAVPKDDKKAKAVVKEKKAALAKPVLPEGVELPPSLGGDGGQTDDSEGTQDDTQDDTDQSGE